MQLGNGIWLEEMSTSEQLAGLNSQTNLTYICRDKCICSYIILILATEMDIRI